jgi:predicted kinase
VGHVPSLVLTCGVAGSGKSTYARGLESQGWLRLSIDAEAWRRGLTEHPLPAAVTADIVAQQRGELLDALAHGRDVVVDYSFWSRATRETYRELGTRAGAVVQVVWFDVPREELRRRLDARVGEGGPDSVRVPDAVLDRYVAGFEAPGPEEEDVVRFTSAP